MNYWLMKSEPAEYSIDNLKKDKVEMWDGVRNYQVRNMMRDDMKVGDKALFYHSNAGTETGVVGEMKIVKKAYPDPTQFDKTNKHFDVKSDPENPRWLCVDAGFVKKFKNTVSLSEIKNTKQLQKMQLVKKGNRLSVMALTKTEFDKICSMGNS